MQTGERNSFPEAIFPDDSDQAHYLTVMTNLWRWRTPSPSSLSDSNPSPSNLPDLEEKVQVPPSNILEMEADNTYDSNDPSVKTSNKYPRRDSTCLKHENIPEIEVVEVESSVPPEEETTIFRDAFESLDSPNCFGNCEVYDTNTTEPFVSDLNFQQGEENESRKDNTKPLEYSPVTEHRKRKSQYINLGKWSPFSSSSTSEQSKNISSPSLSKRKPESQERELKKSKIVVLHDTFVHKNLLETNFDDKDKNQSFQGPHQPSFEVKSSLPPQIPHKFCPKPTESPKPSKKYLSLKGFSKLKGNKEQASIKKETLPKSIQFENLH